MLKPISDEDLVYLIFVSSCATEVTRQKPDDVIVNLEDNTWEWQDNTWEWRGHKFRIGQPNSQALYMGSPIIGVYDRTDDKQLSAMVSHGHKVCSPDSD